MVNRALVTLLSLAACQGSRRDVDPGSGSAVTEPARDAAPVESDADLARDDAPGPEEPEPPDPGKLIAELGAISAWQAVIDRAQLLARRGQHGVVYGRLGPPVMVPAPPAAGSGSASPPALVASSHTWLVDDTEGNGSLGIRVALGAKASQAKLGDRVALGGAWELDESRRWFWKVDSLQAVPPGPPSTLKEPPPPEPSHTIANGNLTPGARTITVARDHDAAYFQLVGPPPANDGDGWPVADELGDRVYALLVLPGERASYGGQDMRAADERWQLRKAQTYVVRLGRIRTRGPDKPVVIHARTAPVRVN